MYYKKICAICSRSFHCMRINTLYCSKKCANRTRSLPKPLVEQLVKRSQRYLMHANNYVAMVENPTGEVEEVGETIEGATKENPLGKEEGFLYAVAKQMKTDRDSIERQQKSFHKEIEKSVSFKEAEVMQSNDTREIEQAMDNADKDIKNKPREYVLNEQTGAKLIVREPSVKAPETLDKETGFNTTNPVNDTSVNPLKNFDLGENIEPITDNMIDPEMKDFVLEDEEDLQGIIQGVEEMNQGKITPIEDIRKKSKIRRIGDKS